MLLLALVAACLPKHVDKPDFDLWEWRPDRAALPGGSLRVLHVATGAFAESLALAHGSKRELVSPLSVYLFTHPTEGLVLIDTGFGRRTAADPADYPGKLTARAIGLEMGVPAVERLEQAGLSDVRHLLVTHLHADHAGGIADFPGAALHVVQAEWRAGARKRVLRSYLPSPYADHALIAPISYEDRPYGPFARHADLFGDDSLVVLPTPGHTPGHSSVLVNLKGGSFLITGDVAWIDENWERPSPKGWAARTVLEFDWKQEMDALWRIRDWAQRYPDLVVISGHEPKNLERLKRWPDAYH